MASEVAFLGCATSLAGLKQSNMDKHENIMQIVLHSLGCSRDEVPCSSNVESVRYICANDYNGDYVQMFKEALDLMTIQQFNRIKKLDD